MSVIHSIIWLLAGMVLMGLIVWFTMPLLMLLKYRSKFNYDETIAFLSETFKKKEDWRILAVNDYQKTTEAFVKLERVGSINFCNPRRASQILADDKNRGVTALMPMGLGVYEDKKGQVFISILNFGLLGKMFGGTISEVMGKAGNEVTEVIKSVSTN